MRRDAKSSQPSLTWRGWATYALVWTGFTLVYAEALSTKPGMGSWRALWWTFLDLLPAALMGVFVWHLSRRLSLVGRRPISLLLIHAVAAFVFTSVWLGFTALSILFGAGISGVSMMMTLLPGIMRPFWGWHLVEGAVIYAVIAGVSYAVMAERARRTHMEAAAAADAMRARAELAALRAQVNPHFLFNTLHSVTQLIREQPAAAADAVERLGNLFRYALDSCRNPESADEARLGDEWAFTKNYLALESLRLGSRLKIIELFDPQVSNCVVPALTLQPLVENAIKHAAVDRREPTTIEIRAHRRDGEVVIEVADDGPGAESSRWSSGNGVGLRAVRQRLEAAHGNASRFEVETSPGNGFRVRLTLPADDGLPAKAHV